MDADTFKALDSLKMKTDLVSVDFSEDNKFILIAYKNEVVISNLQSLRDINNFKVKGKNISDARFSHDSKNPKLLVTSEDGVQVNRSYFNRELQDKMFWAGKGDGIVNAVFSENDKWILA